MYGLEKNKKFDFDLEIEIKKNPQRKKEILKNAKEMEKKIKKELKDNKDNLEEYGILLNGYDSLEKVLEKVK